MLKPNILGSATPLYKVAVKLRYAVNCPAKEWRGAAFPSDGRAGVTMIIKDGLFMDCGSSSDPLSSAKKYRNKVRNDDSILAIKSCISRYRGNGSARTLF